MEVELRTYAFIDRMQPQAAAHVAATCQGDVPVAEVVAAGQAVREHLQLAEADRVKPKRASSMFVTNVSPYQAQLINKWRKGNLLIPGQSLYVLEVSPAAYVSLAANEAEKAADISIIEVRALGRFGRLFISGTESDVQAAAAAAIACLEELEGK